MKNRKLMMPLFSFLCFIIVTASPIFLSLKDSQSVNNSADSVDSETYSYTYNDVGLKFLEKSIAKANGVLDYASPSENSEMLAKTIIRFSNLTKKEKLEMGNNARKYFEKEFERNKLLSKLIDIFKA